MGTCRAILVIDLAFGDSGKGTIVDYLVRRSGAHTVVRFNGGPQAGHNVVTPDGRHHTFAQFGSGTFVPGVRTLLSRSMLIEPYALFNEARHLEELGVSDAMGRLLIDGQCPVITPAHQAANRIRELARGQGAHGTCGMGVGELMADQIADPELTLRFQHLSDRPKVLRSLGAIVSRKRDELAEQIRSLRGRQAAEKSLQTLLNPSWIDVAADNYLHLRSKVTMADATTARQLFCRDGTTVFEGAQGVLIDEWYGFHPHTTWSTTTFTNADQLLDEVAHDGSRTRIGVLRAYFTRHGPGPFVTEDPSLGRILSEAHNDDVGWQGRFRVGHFDAVALRYALDVAGPIDQLAVTHLDRWPYMTPQICTAYQVGKTSPALREFCGIDSDIIRRLPMKPAPNLRHQERLAGLCAQCQPLLESIAGTGAEPLLSRIADETGVACTIGSFGPAATHKRELPIQASGYKE